MTEKCTDKDPAQKLAKQRFSVLEMTEAPGNVSEACSPGLHQFYEWKRWFQTHGMEGLIDQPPIIRHQPNSTPPETEAKVIAASLEHPS